MAVPPPFHLDLVRACTVLVSHTVVPGVAEAVVAAEDDAVVTTVIVRKKLALRVPRPPRANILRKKVRLEKQKQTTRDVLRAVVADEAFMAEAGIEAEVDGPTLTPITDIMVHMDDEDLRLHLEDQEVWVHST
jgi:hypothetical protein